MKTTLELRVATVPGPIRQVWQKWRGTGDNVNSNYAMPGCYGENDSDNNLVQICASPVNRRSTVGWVNCAVLVCNRWIYLNAIIKYCSQRFYTVLNPTSRHKKGSCHGIFTVSHESDIFYSQCRMLLSTKRPDRHGRRLASDTGFRRRGRGGLLNWETLSHGPLTTSGQLKLNLILQSSNVFLDSVVQMTWEYLPGTKSYR